MVKHLNIDLDDEEYDTLIKEKKNKTWKEYLLQKVKS